MQSKVCTGLAACVIAVTLVLAGCRASGPASIAPAVHLSTAALDLLTQSGAYSQRQHLLKAAEETLVGRCMSARGIAYPAEPPVADRRTDEEKALEIEERRRVGYGLAKPAGSDVPPLDRYVQSLPQAKQEAFTAALFGRDDQRRAIKLPGGGEVGFPGAGCLAEAQQQIFGDVLTWARITYLPADFNNKLARLATSSPAYLEAMRSWAKCMALKGYAYKSPADARDDVQARYKAGGVTEALKRQEIAVAVADAECATEMRVPRLVTELKRSNVITLSEPEQRSLHELSDKWLLAVTIATDIVND